MFRNLQHLSYVVAAADFGGIARAAEEIGVSQAAISAAINNVESYFKIRVFVRNPARGLALTRSGQRFISNTRVLLADVEGFEAETLGMSLQLSGPLEVGCFLPAAPFVLPPVIRTMAFRHPAIEIRIHENDVATLLECLKNGTVDVAMTYDFNLDKRVEFLPLMKVPLHVLLSADDPLAKQEVISLSELENAPMVLLDLPGSRERYFEIFRFLRLVPRVRLRTRSVEMVRSLVAAGLGYALLGFLPASSRSIDGSELVYRPLADELPLRYFGLAYAEKAIKTRVMRTFEETCCRLFRDEDGANKFIVNEANTPTKCETPLDS